MRLVVQRVTRAVVRSGDQALGSIGRGAVVLVGVAATDDDAVVDRMADKLVAMRYFTDAEDRTNLALADIGGALLVVSQFTLLADTRHGRRPGFADAAGPEQARPLVDRFVSRLRDAGARVETGEFGARMEVELVNDGPFTLVVDD
ncbi:MAG TPA: D-aminoacyl-tRNA deacylase [Candidatus Limnocylindria bacterium]|nr:D-aminoacyl-tRNA deacylase [Candidatus Limnocylindria bacterium]